MAAGTQNKFTVSLTSGYALWEYFPGMSGTSVDDLFADPNFPFNPAQRAFLTAFTTDPSYSGFADNYSERAFRPG